jgi:uncharacterized damage-inducible protein DinB
MNTPDVRTLFAYNRWANARLMAAAAALPQDEFTRDLGASFGSLRGTLLHIFAGERLWLQHWLDGTRPQFDLDAYPDAAAVERIWNTWEAERAAFGESLTDERLASRIAVREHEYALADLVQHILNHSTYHRGQVTILLRQLGHTPPATDYRLFLNETGRASPPAAQLRVD